MFSLIKNCIVMALIVSLCGCASAPEVNKVEPVDFEKMLEEMMPPPASKKDFEELYNHYREEYNPKKRQELLIDIPDFPLEEVEKECKVPEKWKYDFLSGALVGWYYYYHHISLRGALSNGYREGYKHGLEKASKMKKKKN